MSINDEVREDLKRFSGDRAKLMQEYSNRQQLILKDLGGNLSDIPMDPQHSYHQLQLKIVVLGRMS
jgi:hypothetical protein